MRRLVIATRGSALALWQARHVEALLKGRYSDVKTELLILKTKGDVILDVPLAKVGGKGLFVKEIEEALLQGRADIAVHSMKDVPMILPDGLTIGAVPERESCADVYLSEKYPSLESLPEGAVVGTSSLRRQAQLLLLRPDLNIAMLRGNVETRVRKMNEGHYDAIILARAGLNRLGVSAAHMQELLAPAFLPAVGQGALGVEISAGREDLKELLSFMEHSDTRLCVTAERSFLRRLDGGCQVPIAAHAELDGDSLVLQALIADPCGKKVLRDSATCHAVLTEADSLGRSLAEKMIAMGAGEMLRQLYEKNKG